MNRYYPHRKFTNRPGLLHTRAEQQRHLVHTMEAQRNQPATVLSKTVRQKIIEKYLDPDSGLLDKLLGCGLLTWGEFDDIKATGGQSKRNEKLLSVILTKHLYQDFLDLLNETQHSHLVDYKTDSDYYHRIFNGDIPLTTREETILDLNREVIVELFKDSTQVVEQLYEEAVLSEIQMDRLRSTPGNIQRGEMLVNMIRGRSLRDLKTVIHSLRETRQTHLANIFEEGGVTGRVKCHVDIDTEPIDEDRIVNGFLRELNDHEYRMDGFESNLRLLGLGLSYVRRNKGIILYFHFRSLDDLRALKTHYDSGSLKLRVLKDFNSLVTLPIDEEKVNVEWAKFDYHRCELYFTLVPSTAVNDLPLEILDLILRRSIRHMMLPGAETKSSMYCVDKLSCLASVSYCWARRISLLKKAALQNCTTDIQKVKKRSVILRNNREYLLSEIRPNELIDQLVQSGCLDEKQASSLRRLESETDKNFRLLRIARRFSSQKHFRFVDSLYLTNQLNVAKIVERGGGTVKMCIENDEAIPNAVEKDLLVKLQKMLREEIDEKLWPHNLFNSLSIYDIVILSAQQGQKVIELWLWCQSQEGLDRLRVADESELIRIMEQMFQRLQSSTPLKPQNVYIDSEYFKHDVVVRHMSVRLLGTLCPIFQRSTGVFQVCSLQDKIYVISGRTTLHIYESKAPCRLLESKNIIPQSRMQNPLELAACPVNRCLYLADLELRESCVWKINPADGHEMKKWLPKQASNLSVSSDGKVLVLDYEEGQPKLNIYTPEAELESAVPLRGHPYNYYRWAAEELMPGVVAMQYEKSIQSSQGESPVSTGIVIVRLNETGDVLLDVETKGIFRVAPYSPGRLIAADQGSKRVIVLDSQLRTIQVLLSPDTKKLLWPQNLCYRRDTQELIVDNFDPSRPNQFNVYKLSYDDEV